MPSQPTAAALLASLTLLLFVNGAPILARMLLGRRWSTPLDRNRIAPDGKPWLGPSKTLRGLLAAILAGALCAPLLGHALWLGAAFGLLAMLGDLLSSLIKRRLGIPSSGMALGLDQLPEALLPLALLREPLGLSWSAVAGGALAFVVLELLLSQLLFRLKVRKHPY